MNDHMTIWNKVKRPPPGVLKSIKGGRLGSAGLSSIDPQWRFLIMTETYGSVGIGWRYEITKLWTEPGSDGQVAAFATVNCFTKTDDGWSEPIPGVGGSMLVVKESSGLHTNDEAFKMATTDALSVAMKPLGVAADVYMGLFDGSKYKDPPKEPEKINDEQLANLEALIKEVGADLNAFVRYFDIGDLPDMTTNQYEPAIKLLEKKRAE